MRRTIRGATILLPGVLALACETNRPPASPAAAESESIQGLQIATDAYLAYQHADCETVYRLTQPQRLDDMQATELRYSLRLVRGFCQELDGDQPAARVTYRRLIQEAPKGSFAAADAQERLTTLDRLVDDPNFARHVEQTARRPRTAPEPREPSDRSDALYPPLARASGVEGFAVVEFGIRRNGQTTDPIVVDSEPPFVFEGTALRAVRSWKYRAKRQADADDRHMIRIVFRTAVAPVNVEEGGDADGGESSATPEPSSDSDAPPNAAPARDPAPRP